MVNKKRGFGTFLILIGFAIILSSLTGITGNVISSENLEKSISSILGLAFVIGGLVVFIGGRSKLENFVNSQDEKESEKAYDRFMGVKSLLEDRKDKKGLYLLEELIKYAGDYVKIVTKLESIDAGQYQNREDKEKIRAIDLRKKIKHDALISQLTIVNRYLFNNYSPEEEIPFGGVYSLPVETLSPKLNRFAVGNWASYIIQGLYLKKNRK